MNRFSVLIATVACFSAIGVPMFRAEEPPVVTPKEAIPKEPKRLKTYVIPEAYFYSCQDIEETTRRWNATKDMMTLDVYSITRDSPPRVLWALVKAAPLKKIETKDEEKTFHVEVAVTEEQDRRIREALDKKTPLLVGYYHYDW